MGPRQQLLVRELVVRLLEGGQWPEDPRRLKGLVGPLVCGTPAEQAEFHDLFEGWVASRAPVVQPHPGIGVERKPERNWAPWAALAVVAVLGLAGTWEYQRRMQVEMLALKPPAPPGPTAPPPPPQRGRIAGVTEPGARVWLPVAAKAEEFVNLANGLGRFQVDNLSQGKWRLLITAEGRKPVEVEAETGGAVVNAPLQVEDRRAVLVPVSEIRRRVPAWLSYVLSVAPLAAAAWWIAALRRRRAELKKWETPLELTPLRVGTRLAESDLFPVAEIANLSRELRRRRTQLTGRVAVEPTVHATIARGGLFTPVAEEEQTAREHLVLMERRSSRDQLTRLYSSFLDRLTARDVYVDRYFFSADPRVCEPMGKERAWVKLEEVAALHPHHELWLVCDGRALFDAITREPLAWLEKLSRWPERTVVTHSALSEDERDRLQRLGFAVKDIAEGQRFYPGLLEEEEMRWLERLTPPEEDARKLERQLRAYLGAAGFRCLAACAAYPGLAWNLTLYLVGKIAKRPSGEPAAAVLARLTRLPWFRHSRMPEWLRVRLLETMDAAERERTLSWLGEFLESARPGRRVSGGLEFVRKTAAAERDDKPLSDHVFLSFVTGRKVEPGAVWAPERLKRLLFEEGMAELGPRPVVIAVLGALLALAVWGTAEWLARAGGKAVERMVAGRREDAVLAVTPAFPWGEAAVGVAGARVGEAMDGAALLALCARRARELTGMAPPDLDFRPGSATYRAHARAAAGPQGIAPGWILVLNNAERSAGFVESVYADGVVTLESAAGRVARVDRRYAAIDGGFVVPPRVQVEAEQFSRVGRDGLTYMWVKPGRFRMGCSPGDAECYDDEKPAREVEITQGFFLGETEVTQAAWKRVMGPDPSGFKGDDLPVERVSWEEAAEYCRKVGGRLPTEAEWEYAARAGTTGSRHGEVDAVAWYGGNSGGKAHPVRGKQSNAFGLYDTLGNVWEWTADWYGPYDAGAVRDPKGATSGSLRVARGGSWSDDPQSVRVSLRVRVEPTNRNYIIGFRCAGEFR